MAVIGITPSNRLNDYVESVRRAGGEPRVLSMEAPPSLEGLDGILFTGGGDVDPAHYHEPRHPNTNEPDPLRDAYELELAKLALAKNTPLLAVCRGLQVVNVAAGGTLIQDISAQMNQESRPPDRHAVVRDCARSVGDAGIGLVARHAGTARGWRSAAGEQPPPSGRGSGRCGLQH